MLAASSQFAAMIDGQDIVCDARVTLTLPGGVYPDVTLAVESLTVQAQITTDMPAGTRLDVGYPKIDADLTLAGLVDQSDETKTAAWLFGPWGARAGDGSVSPLYRTKILYSPVTIDVGLNPDGSGGTAELLRKFTGFIDAVTINQDGSVALSCLDNHTKLRALPTTPPAIVVPPLNAGMTSEYALDELLYRASGGAIGSRPAPRPSCVLNVGLRTSVYPDVGSVMNSVGGVPVFAPAAFGSGLRSSSDPSFSAFGWHTSAPLGTTFFMEAWMTPEAAANIAVQALGPGFSSIGFTLTTTAMAVAAPGDLSTQSWSLGPLSAGPHYVGLKWTQAAGSASWSATAYVDGATHAFSGTSASVRDVGAWNTVLVSTPTNYGGSSTICAIQATNEVAPVANYPFTPTAVLDPSLNTLQAVPAYSGDPWAVIQQISDAELGVAGFDESGIFRFYNRNTLRFGSVVRTLTSATSLLSIGSALSASELINRVQATSEPWAFAAAGLAYSPPTAQRIRAKSTQTINIDLGDVLVGQVYSPAITRPNGSIVTDGYSYFRSSVNQAGTQEAPLDNNNGVTVTQTDSSHVQVTVTNPYWYDIWLVSPANYIDIPVGTPSLWIGGVAATQSDGTVADQQWPPINPDGTGGAATTQAGEVGYSVSGNPWLQDDVTGAHLVADILTDMCVPRPSLTGVEIVPDPRLQLCDRVVVQDPDITNIAEHALLFGWTLAWSTGSPLSMTIDARTIANPGGWILGVSGRSELSTTTLI